MTVGSFYGLPLYEMSVFHHRKSTGFSWSLFLPHSLNRCLYNFSKSLGIIFFDSLTSQGFFFSSTHPRFPLGHCTRSREELRVLTVATFLLGHPSWETWRTRTFNPFFVNIFFYMFFRFWKKIFDFFFLCTKYIHVMEIVTNEKIFFFSNLLRKKANLKRRRDLLLRKPHPKR